MVTGVDIAVWQIRIAARERLALEQRAVQLTGHAIEARVNAEDPAQGFRPTPGKVTHFEIPTDRGPGRVRVDTHVRQGDTIPPLYDSLVAKVIAHGTTRDEAIATLERALGAARIEGIATTVPLHLAVLASAEFRAGRYDTSAIPGWASS
jgi:acetyl-CoA carboxylase biotin carboxylase subunit